jgi:hypothetical protein
MEIKVMSVKDIFKGREWVLELFQKRLTLKETCLEYIKLSQDKEFEEVVQSYIIENDQKRKSNTGLSGDLIEWMITGVRKSSAKLPDLRELGIDIKCLPLRLKKQGYFPTEKLSITSFSNILVEKQSFYESNLINKSKYLMVYFDDSKFYKGNTKVKGGVNHFERVIFKVDYINLSPYFNVMEKDYNHIKNQLIEYISGKKNSISSKQYSRDKEEQILHIKQAGMGAKQTSKYLSIEGKEYEFFPRKWNIGQKAFNNLFLNKN